MAEGLFPNELPQRSLTERASLIMDWATRNSTAIRRLGSPTRIHQMCRVLTGTNGQLIKPDDENWPLARLAMKEIQELSFIIEVLDDQLLEDPFCECLSLLLQDPDLPTIQQRQTPGRDAQWELFMAAVAARAGLSLSRFGPGLPDWKAQSQNETWAIETKRSKNWNGIENVIRKAGTQIARAGIHGVILLDMSFGDNGILAEIPYGTTEEQLADAFARAGNHYRRNLLPRVETWIADKPTVGILGIHQAAPVCRGGDPERGDDWTLYGFWHWYRLRLPDTSVAQSTERLKDYLGVALPQW